MDVIRVAAVGDLHCTRMTAPEPLRRLFTQVSESADVLVLCGNLTDYGLPQVISRAQYLVDVDRWGYEDPRLAPRGNMTERERQIWTAGIAADGPPEAIESEAAADKAA